MTHALSNPYEITVGGITCKCSPFDTGFYIANMDLERMSEEQAAKFKKALFHEYHAEQSRELGGIKIFGKKDK